MQKTIESIEEFSSRTIDVNNEIVRVFIRNKVDKDLGVVILLQLILSALRDKGFDEESCLRFLFESVNLYDFQKERD